MQTTHVVSKLVVNCFYLKKLFIFFATRGQKRPIFSAPTSLKGTTLRGDITAGSCLAIFHGILDTNSSNNKCFVLLTLPILFPPLHLAPLLCFPTVFLNHCCWMHMVTSITPEASRRPLPLVLVLLLMHMYILHIPKYGHEPLTVYVCVKEWINSSSLCVICVYIEWVLLCSRSLWSVCSKDTLLLCTVAQTVSHKQDRNTWQPAEGMINVRQCNSDYTHDGCCKSFLLRVCTLFAVEVFSNWNCTVTHTHTHKQTASHRMCWLIP